MRLKVGKFQATREYKDLIQHIFPSFTFGWFWKNDNADGNFTKLANFNFPNFKNSCVSVECDQTPGSAIPPLLSGTENLETGVQCALIGCFSLKMGLGKQPKTRGPENNPKLRTQKTAQNLGPREYPKSWSLLRAPLRLL